MYLFKLYARYSNLLISFHSIIKFGMFGKKNKKIVKIVGSIIVVFVIISMIMSAVTLVKQQDSIISGHKRKHLNSRKGHNMNTYEIKLKDNPDTHGVTASYFEVDDGYLKFYAIKDGEARQYRGEDRFVAMFQANDIETCCAVYDVTSLSKTA